MWRLGRAVPCRDHRVPCRDHRGRRRELLVTLDGERVVLGDPDGPVWSLRPLYVGRLRAALREAVLRDEP